MKKKASIPPYHDADDGPPTPEQIAENLRMSADTLAALNVAVDMDMSVAEAYAFVLKNRHKLEALASDLEGDLSVADAARAIKALASSSARAAGMANQGKPRTSRFKKEEPNWALKAQIALVRNAGLDVRGIADFIKQETQTRRSIVELRKWVGRNEKALREKAAVLAESTEVIRQRSARTATKRTLSR